MAREFAKQFYHSSQWKHCRESYINCMPIYKRGMCEMCFSRGLVKEGEELHHKIWLTPENIYKPEVTLNHDNLILLCHDCHTKLHAAIKSKKRYMINERGEIVSVE